MMIQAAPLRNPFLAIKVDDTTILPPGDVPELHDKVRQKCRLALEQAQQSGQSIGLLVIGEAGSGKSHLIGRLRSEFASNSRTVLATISLRGAFAGKLWRHVRDRLVVELMKSSPGSSGFNGLLRILHNRFPKWASEQNTKGGLLGFLVGKTKSSLQYELNEFARTCPLDYSLQKVLGKLDHPHAEAWLRGKQLTADDLTDLGLPIAFPSEQEQETLARAVVLSLFRLAGKETTLFVCFDEVEAIQAGTYDVASLRQFSTLATDLLAESGPRVVATFIRPNLLIDLRKAVEAANLQKMGQDTTILPPITWEQAVRLTKARLEAEPSCRRARLDSPEDSFWPLSSRFLESVYKSNKRCLTPRHLIRACAVEFQRLQKTDSEAPSPPGFPANDSSTGNGKPDRKPVRAGTVATKEIHISLTPVDESLPTPPDEKELLRMWEKLRKKYLAKPQEIKFDRTLSIALPWLIHLTKAPLVWIQEPEDCPGDVNLLFQSKRHSGKKVGVSFCHHEPRTLWHRLDRLKVQWTATKGKSLAALVVLRAEGQRTTEGAQTRLKALSGAGVRVVDVPAQSLAEVTAFQVMLTAAQTGDLTQAGKPVEVAEYDAWASENLSGSVKEFIDLVFAL